MKIRSYNRGFILILVLLVLAIAGILLAASGRHSSLKALRTASSMEQLQLKWGCLSCQAMIVPAAESILTNDSNDAQQSVTTSARSITLGGMRFDMVVSDEQAKANVNMMAARLAESLEARIAALEGNTAKALHVNLRPSAPPAGVISKYPMSYSSYEQVLEFSHPSDVVDPQHPEDSCVNQITCWGSGLINFKRASADSLREATTGILDESQIYKLRQFVQQAPLCRLEDVIRNLKLPDKLAAQVRYVLIDSSSCHSLWVVAQGRMRSWHRLYVYSAGDAGTDQQRLAFTW